MPKATASGFIGRVGTANPNATTYSTPEKFTLNLKTLRNRLNGGRGNRRLRTIITALTGAAVGAASKAYSESRAQARQEVGKLNSGGVKTVETVSYQTGVTVAGDLTDVDQGIAFKRRVASYPDDRAGKKSGLQMKGF